jgi:hypothetical protein
MKAIKKFLLICLLGFLAVDLFCLIFLKLSLVITALQIVFLLLVVVCKPIRRGLGGLLMWSAKNG